MAEKLLPTGDFNAKRDEMDRATVSATNEKVFVERTGEASMSSEKAPDMLNGSPSMHQEMINLYTSPTKTKDFSGLANMLEKQMRSGDLCDVPSGDK